MMGSIFGEQLKISIFGESHGTAIGVTIDGLPAGFSISTDRLHAFMGRRKGGQNAFSTPRAEADLPEFLSGIQNEKTTGAPLCAIIHNQNTRSGDYAPFADTPRPSHADFTAIRKWQGSSDLRGGGHFSGRLTAPLCVAGGIALQILEHHGIFVGAHLASVGTALDEPFPIFPDAALFSSIAAKPFPTISDSAASGMQAQILAAREERDSVGGTIECAAIGLPVGLGEPMFDGIENRLAQVIFGIPAVKALEFGGGFALSEMRGSQANDPFTYNENGEIVTKTNNSGGIQGGITNGMPIRLRVGIKPTPSIGRPQQTVSIEKHENTTIEIGGRHDPCIAQRAVPVVEAAVACVLLDTLLSNGK